MINEIIDCPNPWCTSERPNYKLLVSSSGKNKVRCSCGIETPEFSDMSEAIAAWNTRPIEDELRARVKELEAELACTKITAKWSREYSEKLAALEQWQREAVKFLPLAKDDLECGIKHDPINSEEYILEFEQIQALIKQAEGK